MIPFLGRGGTPGRMQPPPVPPLQPRHHQRIPPTSSGEQHQQQQQPQPGYPTGSVGSMDERSSKRRRVDDASGLSVAQQQQQQLAGYPTQQYQNQNQAHLYGSGGPPTNAPVSQPSQPAYGYSSTSTDPSYSHHPHHAYALTPMYAAPIPTAPSHWTGGGGTQGPDRYYYTGAAAYSPSMQAYQQPQYTSPMHTTGTYQIHEPGRSASSGSGPIVRPIPPSATVPLVTRLLSSPARLPQANLTASGVAPNSGAGPSGANINVGGASIGSEPMSSKRRVGVRRRDRTNRRQDSKPYRRAPAASPKSRPITYQGNLVRLQQRCRSQGADEGAIELLGKIFVDEINLEALSRHLTDAEAETKEFGIDTGMLYTALLEHPDEENDGYACGLCDIEKTWKHHRDVLRHLRRDHFGISDDCDRCDKKFYTKSEKKKHLCK